MLVMEDEDIISSEEDDPFSPKVRHQKDDRKKPAEKAKAKTPREPRLILSRLKEEDIRKAVRGRNASDNSNQGENVPDTSPQKTDSRAPKVQLLTCGECDYKTGEFTALVGHAKSHIEAAAKNNEQGPKKRRPSESRSTMKRNATPKNTDDGADALRCGECDFTAVDWFLMIAHMKSHKAGMPSSKSNARKRRETEAPAAVSNGAQKEIKRRRETVSAANTPALTKSSSDDFAQAVDTKSSARKVRERRETVSASRLHPLSPSVPRGVHMKKFNKMTFTLAGGKENGVSVNNDEGRESLGSTMNKTNLANPTGKTMNREKATTKRRPSQQPKSVNASELNMAAVIEENGQKSEERSIEKCLASPECPDENVVNGENKDQSSAAELDAAYSNSDEEIFHSVDETTKSTAEQDSSASESDAESKKSENTKESAANKVSSAEQTSNDKDASKIHRLWKRSLSKGVVLDTIEIHSSDEDGENSAATDSIETPVIKEEEVEEDNSSVSGQSSQSSNSSRPREFERTSPRKRSNDVSERSGKKMNPKKKAKTAPESGATVKQEPRLVESESEDGDEVILFGERGHPDGQEKDEPAKSASNATKAIKEEKLDTTTCISETLKVAVPEIVTGAAVPAEAKECVKPTNASVEDLAQVGKRSFVNSMPEKEALKETSVVSTEETTTSRSDAAPPSPKRITVPRLKPRTGLRTLRPEQPRTPPPSPPRPPPLTREATTPPTPPPPPAREATPPPPPPPPQLRVWKCDQCDFSTADEGELETHTMRHAVSLLNQLQTAPETLSTAFGQLSDAEETTDLLDIPVVFENDLAEGGQVIATADGEEVHLLKGSQVVSRADTVAIKASDVDASNVDTNNQALDLTVRRTEEPYKPKEQEKPKDPEALPLGRGPDQQDSETTRLEFRPSSPARSQTTEADCDRDSDSDFVPEGFDDKERPRGRRRKEKVQKEFACEHCDYSSDSKLNLRSHVLRLHTRRIHCTAVIEDENRSCPFSTGEFRVFKKHLKAKHMWSESAMDAEVDRIKEARRTAALICSECNHVAKDKAALNRHVQRKHRSNLKCGWCEFATGNRVVLQGHMKTHGEKSATEKENAIDESVTSTTRTYEEAQSGKDVSKQVGTECAEQREEILEANADDRDLSAVESTGETATAGDKYATETANTETLSDCDQEPPSSTPTGQTETASNPKPAENVASETATGSQQQANVVSGGVGTLPMKGVFFKCALCPVMSNELSLIQQHMTSVHNAPQPPLVSNATMPTAGGSDGSSGTPQTAETAPTTREQLQQPNPPPRAQLQQRQQPPPSSPHPPSPPRPQPIPPPVSNSLNSQPPLQSQKSQEHPQTSPSMQQDPQPLAQALPGLIQSLQQQQALKVKCGQCDFFAADASSLTLHLISHLKPIKPNDASSSDQQGKDAGEIVKEGQVDSPPVKKAATESTTSEGTSPSAKQGESSKPPEKGSSFKCGGCNFKCTDLAVLREHLVESHTVKGREKNPPPPPIEKKTKEPLEASKEGSLRCGECDYATSSMSELKRHLMLHATAEREKAAEAQKKEKSSTTPSPTNVHGCKDCPFSGPTKEDLESHIRQHHRQEQQHQFRCGECDFSTSDVVLLTAHLADHAASTKQQVRSTDGNYPCNYCAYRGKSRASLGTHVRAQHSKRYMCGECGFARGSKTALTRHCTGKHPNASIITVPSPQPEEVRISSDDAESANEGEICENQPGAENSSLTEKTSSQTASVAGQPRKLYLCDDCDFESTSKAEVKAHKSKEHATGDKEDERAESRPPVQEPVAPVTATRNIFDDPLQIHDCCDCDFIGDSKEELKEHIAREHSNSKDASPPPTTQTREDDSLAFHSIFVDDNEPVKIAKAEAEEARREPSPQKQFSQASSVTKEERQATWEDDEVDWPAGTDSFDEASQDSFLAEEDVPNEPVNSYSCDDCPGKSFSSKSSLAGHRQFKHPKPEPEVEVVTDNPEDVFLCLDCEFQSLSKEEITEHLKQHDSALRKPAKETPESTPTPLEDAIRLHCKECSFYTTGADFLEEHVRAQHQGIKDQKCDECDFSTGYAHTLKQHKAEKHGAVAPRRMMHTCEHCNFCAHSRDLLERHVRMKHKTVSDDNVERIGCGDCDKTFASSSRMEAHRSNMHGEGNPYVCHKCDFKTTGGVAYRRHMLENHADFVCGRVGCDFKAVKENEFNEHLRSDHGDISDATHVCDDCGFATAFEEKLDKHREVKHPVGPTYDCDSCEFSVKTPQQLRYHIENYHWGVTYKCDECDFETASKRGFEYHVQTALHKNCDQCDFVAPSPTALSRHDSEVHWYAFTADGGYECQKCQHRENTERKIVKHYQRHHKLDYRCESCDYAGGDSQDLRHHRDRFHLERFKCDRCDFLASSNEHLAKHNEIHQTRNCPDCDFCCDDREELFVHYTTDHCLDIVSPEDGDGFDCFSCKKCRDRKYTTEDEFELRRHAQKVHLRVRAYHCKYCNFSSNHRMMLTNHEAGIHRAAQCDLCDSALKGTKALVKHREQVHGLKQRKPEPKVLKCSICDFETLKKQSLSVHLWNKHSLMPGMQEYYNSHRPQQAKEEKDGGETAASTSSAGGASELSSTTNV